MPDIALSWTNTPDQSWGYGDWTLNDNQVLSDDEDLYTSVMLSLYSDRTANPDDVIPDKGQIRGWWADTYREYPLGSRLWLLWREKKTETTRRRAEEYANEAMEWFVLAGVARKVEVAAKWLYHPDATGYMEITITIYPPRGSPRIWKFPFVWAQLAGVTPR